MKLFKRFLYVAASLLLMTSCSNENAPSSGEEPEDLGRDGVFMSLRLNPSGSAGSRSQTVTPGQSTDGVEVGTEAENAIETALIVLADRENKYIASAMVPGDHNSGSITGGTVNGTTLYQAVAKFDKSTIADYYDAGGDGKINVFVFCNPTSHLTKKIEETETGDVDWTNAQCEEPTTLWQNASGNPLFIMSNLSIAERELPSNISEWVNYNTAAKAFDLSGSNAPGTEGAVDNLNNGRGYISVCRLAARFDFRDGSQVKDAGNGIEGEAFTYATVNNVNGENIVKCKILAMALTNMSKTQYYLSRVSDNGRPSGTNYQLCGPEKAWIGGQGGNYVISTNYTEKSEPIEKDFATYFQYPFFTPQGIVSSKGEGWDWIYCTDLIKHASDNYVHNEYNKSFHVWRYVTENTIPRPRTQDPLQVNSQSTGVIFKTRLLPTDKLNDAGSDKWENEMYTALEYSETNVGTNKLLHHNADLDPILYSLSGNSLYVTWQNVQAAALAEAGYDETKGSNQNLDYDAPLYRLVYGNGGAGTVGTFTDTKPMDEKSPNWLWEQWQQNSTTAQNETRKSAFKKAATTAGFTLYQSSQDPVTGEWGYYCYYYYWNRHNDNLQDGVMGPMEFAVVHNNVYKLTVTNLKTLGHPRIPENDPDDPKPDTPDEKSEVYLTVTVDVVPWVVRINNIEF